jgi:hypothetical protein
MLYTWGFGENGQLGHGADEHRRLPIVVHDILGSVIGQVVCGEHHTVVLTCNALLLLLPLPLLVLWVSLLIACVCFSFVQPFPGRSIRLMSRSGINNRNTNSKRKKKQPTKTPVA